MLHEKITKLIQEETKNLNIPAQFHKTESILVAKGKMDVILGGDKVEIKVIIKLNSKGYWICIGELVKMVKTIDQVNEVLDIETRQKELIAERDKLIDRLVKSGLNKIDLNTIDPINGNLYPGNPRPFWSSHDKTYTAFKISDDKVIQIIKYDKWKPLDEKIVLFHCTTNSNINKKCHPKYFDRTLKNFLSGKEN
jgi:hypothetical protein